MKCSRASSLRRGRRRLNRAVASQAPAHHVAEALEARRLLTTYVVTTLAESGTGSLRNAIALSNANPGTDTIAFKLGQGTIALKAGQMEITDSVNIIGPGQSTLAVSGAKISRIFQIDASARVAIRGLTITNGAAAQGGGIYNLGTLLLLSDTISFNHAFDGTTASPNGSSGGGIYNAGTLTVDACTIQGNSAGSGVDNANNSPGVGGSGGGIYDAGAALTILNSTLSSNFAGTGGPGTTTSNGGPGGFGGAIASTGVAQLINSTVAENQSGQGGQGAPSTFSPGTAGGVDGSGGGIATAGALTLTNCTITNNVANAGTGASQVAPTGGSGGGLWESVIAGIANPPPRITLGNTIVANNLALQAPEVSGGVKSLGNNLIRMGEGSAGWLSSDQVGNVDIPVNPMLSELVNNGGTTLTETPLRGSPAIDRGSNALAVDENGNPLTSDQRGMPRIFNGTVDVGAVEYEPIPIDVNTPSDQPASGVMTLRQAIAQANQTPGPDIIAFDPAAFPAGVLTTITLTQGPLTINDPTGQTILQGPGASALAISGNFTDRVLQVADVAATVSGLTITGGLATIADSSFGGSAAAILNLGTLTVNSCVITGNVAPDVGGLGGAILSFNTLAVTNTTFTNNAADTAGGAIDNISRIGVISRLPSPAICQITNCSFTGNSALRGGAIYNDGTQGHPQLDVNNSSISGNSASVGAGIYNLAGMVTIEGGSQVTSNTASQYGGGLFSAGGSGLITGSTLSKDVAKIAGGDVYIDRSPFTATDSSLGNTNVVFTTLLCDGSVDVLSLTISDLSSSGKGTPTSPQAIVAPPIAAAPALVPAGVIVPPNGGTVVIAAGATMSGSAVLFTGDGAVNITADNTSPGKLVLGGSVTFAGAAGTYAAVQSVGTGTSAGMVDLSGASQTFTVDYAANPADLTLAAQFIDGGIAKNGAGSMLLDLPTTYALGTTIAAGLLELGDANAAGTGPISFAGGTLGIAYSGVPLAQVLDAAVPADTISVDVGSFAAQATLGAPGAGLDVLGLPNSGSLTLTGGNLTLGGNLTIANAVPLTLATGTIGGPFMVTAAGPSTLTLAGTLGNAWTGGTEVEGGVLALDQSGGAAVPGNLRINGPATVRLLGPSQIAAAGQVTFDDTVGPSVLDLNGQTQQLGAIVSFQAGAGAILLNGGTLGVGGASSFTYSGTISGAGTLLKTGTGTFLLGHNASGQNLNGLSLIVASGTLADVDPTGDNAVTALSINAAGGAARFDLGRSTLHVVTLAGPDPLPTLRALMADAYAGGTWTGGGLTTTSGLALGYADGTLHQGGLPIGTMLIKPTIAGDANLDGKVDVVDLGVLATNFGKAAAVSWGQGDFNYSGSADVVDLGILATNFGKSAPAVLRAAAATDLAAAAADIPARRANHAATRRVHLP